MFHAMVQGFARGAPFMTGCAGPSFPTRWWIDWLFSRQTISMISVSGMSCQVSRVVNGRV